MYIHVYMYTHTHTCFKTCNENMDVMDRGVNRTPAFLFA